MKQSSLGLIFSIKKIVQSGLPEILISITQSKLSDEIVILSVASFGSGWKSGRTHIFRPPILPIVVFDDCVVEQKETKTKWRKKHYKSFLLHFLSLLSFRLFCYHNVSVNNADVSDLHVVSYVVLLRRYVARANKA